MSDQVQATESTEAPATPQTRVTMETFIDTYIQVYAGLKSGELTGKGSEIVASRLDLKPDSVMQRATKYRSEYGAALPKFPRAGGRKFDKDAATKAIEAALAKYVKADDEGEKADTPAE